MSKNIITLSELDIQRIVLRVLNENNVSNFIYEDLYGSVELSNFNINNFLNEGEYQGRKVQLGKIMQGDIKKFKVYVKNDKGKIVKVNFDLGGVLINWNDDWLYDEISSQLINTPPRSNKITFFIIYM